MIDLKAIEGRAAKATPVDDRIMRFRYQHGGGRMIRDERELVLDVYDEANREFYFSARTDIPALCQEASAGAAEVRWPRIRLRRRPVCMPHRQPRQENKP